MGSFSSSRHPDGSFLSLFAAAPLPRLSSICIACPHCAVVAYHLLFQIVLPISLIAEDQSLHSRSKSTKASAQLCSADAFMSEFLRQGLKRSSSKNALFSL